MEWRLQIDEVGKPVLMSTKDVREPAAAPVGAPLPRVLVADDDATTRLLVAESLRDAGFDVVEAADGESALERLADPRETVDAVLLDVMMPGMNGFTTCRHIRDVHRRADVPVLIMTSRSDVDSVSEAFDAGATDFVNKPLNFEALPHRLRFLLRARRTQRELRETRERLADAQRVAGLGSFLLDPERRSFIASTEATTLLGLSDAPLVPLAIDTVAKRFSEEDQERIRRALSAGCERRSFEVEARIAFADGLERVLRLRSEPGEREGENGPVAGTVRDLTDQRRSERRQLQLSVLGHALSVIAGTEDFDSLAEETLRRLVTALAVEQARLLVFDDGAERPVRTAMTRSPDGEIRVIREPRQGLGARDRALIDSAPDRGECANELRDGKLYVMVPLTLPHETLGALLVDGLVSKSASDRDDEISFLRTVASHLAVALERARAAAKEERWRRREQRKLRAEVEKLRRDQSDNGGVELVFRSEAMRELVAVVERVGPTDATVLVTGESGTGKELIARATHFASPRRARALIVIDCASIPATLLESELFGHVKGAYTGATEDKPGRLAEADGGTVVLDEIGELPLELQSKLLRFVQEKHFVPVGGTASRKVDVRVIAVTNRDLGKEVREKRFREDLYHRLNVIRLHVAALRDRAGDAAFLAEHFARKYSVHYDKDAVRYFSEATLRAVRCYPWPGNVRELQNRVMRAVILSDAEALDEKALGITLPRTPDAEVGSTESSIPDVSVPVARAEPALPLGERAAASPWSRLWLLVEDLLDAAVQDEGTSPHPPVGRILAAEFVLAADRKAGGVCTQAAKLLGLPEATFRRRLKRAKAAPELPPDWEALREIVTEVVSAPPRASSEGLADAVRSGVLERLEARSFLPRQAAQLMAVSLPTYRRWRTKNGGQRSAEAAQSGESSSSK